MDKLIIDEIWEFQFQYNQWQSSDDNLRRIGLLLKLFHQAADQVAPLIGYLLEANKLPRDFRWKVQIENSLSKLGFREASVGAASPDGVAGKIHHFNAASVYIFDFDRTSDEIWIEENCKNLVHEMAHLITLFSEQGRVRKDDELSEKFDIKDIYTPLFIFEGIADHIAGIDRRLDHEQWFTTQNGRKILLHALDPRQLHKKIVPTSLIKIHPEFHDDLKKMGYVFGKGVVQMFLDKNKLNGWNQIRDYINGLANAKDQEYNFQANFGCCFDEMLVKEWVKWRNTMQGNCS